MFWCDSVPLVDAQGARFQASGGYGPCDRRASFGNPLRLSVGARREGVHWVPLTEHSLAAADWLGSEKENRRDGEDMIGSPLRELDPNNHPAPDVAMKQGRTPAFVKPAYIPPSGVHRPPSVAEKRLSSIFNMPMLERLIDVFSPSLLRGAERTTEVEGPVLCERMLPELKADSVMWYLLQLSRGSGRWVIMRRYREWHAFRQSLRQAGVDDGTIPFPGKRLPWVLCALASGSKHDPHFISQRTAMLHRYATAVLALEGAAENELVIEFFELRWPPVA